MPQELRGQLERYVKAACKVTRSAAQPARVRRINANDAKSQEIRNWAKERGLEINDHGRIPADIVAQYETENGKWITTSCGLAPATLSIHPPDGRLHRDRNTPCACRPCRRTRVLTAGMPCEMKHCQRGSRIVTAVFRRSPGTADINQLYLCQPWSRQLSAAAQAGLDHGGLDLCQPMFAPCLLGCPGTPRQHPVSAARCGYRRRRTNLQLPARIGIVRHQVRGEDWNRAANS